MSTMKLYIGLLLLTLCTVNGQDCFGEGNFGNDIKTKQVITGAEGFGISVFSNIAKRFSTASFIMSPYSIWSVLKLAYYGSSGETKIELEKALGVPSKRDAFWGSHLIELRRKVSQDTSLSSFDQAYFANDVALRKCAIGKVVGIKQLDFQSPAEAANIINRDISEATKGEIRDFVNGNYISKARFILINALYFKGKWITQFDKSKTKDAPFYDESGTAMETQARMMEVSAKFKYGHSNNLGAEIVELPYKDSAQQNTSLTMMILKPIESQTVNNVLDKLTPNSLNEAIRSMTSNKYINLQLPAFNFTTKIDRLLRDSLTNIGIKSLFDPSRANLKDFVPNENLAVSNALHQATIRVDEEGTVASAVTGLVVTRTGVDRIINFIANKPFLFLIRDNAVGITYFIGVYRDPIDSVVA